MAFDPSNPPRGQRPAPGQNPRRTAPSGAPGRRPSENSRRKPAAQPSAGRPASSQSPKRPSAGAKGYQPRYAARTRRKKRRNPGLLALLVILLLGTLTLTFVIGNSRKEGPPQKETEQMTQPTEGKPVLPHVVSTAKITVTGDLLPHKPLYEKGTVIYQDAQDYDFSPIFKYLKGYTDTADYAVANLETSLFGPEKPYVGNPRLNTPDQIVDGAGGAGFDMLLTANNHCNDTDLPGVLRTVKVIREKGLTALGTNLTDEEQKYHIEDLNGIQIGMLCYTYEDSQDPRQVTLNYHPLPKESSGLVCTFPKFTEAKSREPFYEQISAQMEEMRRRGAEFIVLFLHWGEEYHLEPSMDQREMAQRLCDLGVDVIVGGHPHVVEPVELFTGTTDPEHRMVCLYSLGNAVSNQRREAMKSQKSGHTEDGMLFNLTFQRYSDDSVYLSSVEVIPTWVYKHSDAEGKREDNILPLDDSTRDRWQTVYGLDEGTALLAAQSYDRTMAIVGPGLTQSNEWLSRQLPHEEVQETRLPEGE